MLLETVLTETLPEGTLFVSPDGVLYEVVMAERAGFRKAEPWPWSAFNLTSETRQPVALVPGSLLARNYPVVAEGRPLPMMTRPDMLGPDGQPAHFTFPNEQLAKLAAQLDATLTPQSGLAAHKELQRWILSDGHHFFRVYHYRVDSKGEELDLAARFTREHITARDCEQGPRYWQYIPGWSKPAEVQSKAAETVTQPAGKTAPPEKVSPAIPASAREPQARPTPEPSPQPAAQPAPEPTPALPAQPSIPESAPKLQTPQTPEPPLAPHATPPTSEPAPMPQAHMPAPEPLPKLPALPTASHRSIERRFDFRSLFAHFARKRQDKHPEAKSAISLVEAPRPEDQRPVGAPAQPVKPAVETQPPDRPVAEAPPAVASPSEAQAAPPQPAAPVEAVEPVAQPIEPAATQPRDAAADQAKPAKPIAPKPRKPRRTLMTVLSVDIGYGYTKGVGPDGMRFAFPSVIGTAEDIRFATNLISGDGERTVQYGDWQFFYGEQALLQSRIQSTIFDRSRVHDQLYKMLFVAALVEMSRLAPDIERVKVVTGLPVEFFADRADVVDIFQGAYQIVADRPIKCTVESVFVAPQPFGSLFRELLNDQGKIANSEIEKGRVGIIDVGTYTTDFVVSDELRYVQRLSGSIRIGWSKVVNKVQQALSDQYRLELMPHQVDRALKDGEVRVRGEQMPLQPLMEPAVAEVQAALIARARDLWGEGTHLDTILVTGGGAANLYDSIHDVYPHARLLPDAFWANAEGLQRFGRRPATFKE
jgi:plasmid segregation protein ParM